MLEKLLEQKELIQENLRERLDGIDENCLDDICQIVAERFDILIKEQESIELDQQVRNSY